MYIDMIQQFHAGSVSNRRRSVYPCYVFFVCVAYKVVPPVTDHMTAEKAMVMKMN